MYQKGPLLPIFLNLQKKELLKEKERGEERAISCGQNGRRTDEKRTILKYDEFKDSFTFTPR